MASRDHGQLDRLRAYKTKHDGLIIASVFYALVANKASSSAFNPHVATQKFKIISDRAPAP